MEQGNSDELIFFSFPNPFLFLKEYLIQVPSVSWCIYVDAICGK